MPSRRRVQGIDDDAYRVPSVNDSVPVPDVGRTRSAPSLALILPALGLTQIISWGSLYYSLAILAAPIHAELGFSPLTIFGAFTLGMLLSGVVSPYVGRWIDRRGGRWLMASGSVLAALAFLLLTVAHGPITFALAWLIAGLAMAGCLYEPAFATLHQLSPARYRRMVTILTLFGGFASTVFWPLSYALVDAFGWRATVLAFSLTHLLVCAPVHALLLPSRAHRKQIAAAPAVTLAPTCDPRYHWLAISFASATFVFAVLSSFLISVLENRNFATQDAVVIAAVIGPMQVLGRAVEWVLSARVSVLKMGVVAFSALALAMLVLASGEGEMGLGIVFAVLYGTANGVMTIVRGAAPLELFGGKNVGALLGQLARPNFIAKALAPALFAGFYQLGMTHALGLLILGGLSVAALISFVIASRPSKPMQCAAS